MIAHSSNALTALRQVVLAASAIIFSMQVPEDSSHQVIEQKAVGSEKDLAIRAIAYSLDTLIPGLYLWCGPLKIRLGGSRPEPSYPGIIHSDMGFAIVLPGYRIYSTYQGNYDPR